MEIVSSSHSNGLPLTELPPVFHRDLTQIVQSMLQQPPNLNTFEQDVARQAGFSFVKDGVLLGSTGGPQPSLIDDDPEYETKRCAVIKVVHAEFEQLFGQLELIEGSPSLDQAKWIASQPSIKAATLSLSQEIQRYIVDPKRDAITLSESPDAAAHTFLISKGGVLSISVTLPLRIRQYLDCEPIFDNVGMLQVALSCAKPAGYYNLLGDQELKSWLDSTPPPKIPITKALACASQPVAPPLLPTMQDLASELWNSPWSTLASCLAQLFW